MNENSEKSVCNKNRGSIKYNVRNLFAEVVHKRAAFLIQIDGDVNGKWRRTK